MWRKPLSITDVDDIAEGVAREFRECAERVARLRGRRPMDGLELERIAIEVERLVIRLMGDYIRDFEPIRDRASLVPAGEKEGG